MRKMSEIEMRTADGGRKHWYVLSCNRCSLAFQDSFIGALAATAHIKIAHGGNADYYFNDVCVAMGVPH